jgi:hypothetical protein
VGNAVAGTVGLAGQADNGDGFAVVEDLGDASHGRLILIGYVSLSGLHQKPAQCWRPRAGEGEIA